MMELLVAYGSLLVTHLPGDGEQDVGGGLPPGDIVLRAGGGHGQEEQRQVVLARQLLHGGHVARKTAFNYMYCRNLNFPPKPHPPI